MTHAQLHRDLSASIEDGQIYARQQISGAVEFLTQAQRFSIREVRCIVEEILSELEIAPEQPAVVAGTQYVN